MAIKLSKDFKRLQSSNTGFDLIFTDGETYNLDEIIASHDRMNPDGELIIQVKDGRTIAERVLADLMDSVKNEIKTTLSDSSEVKQDINNIIKLVFKRYNYEFNSVSDTLYYDAVTSDNVPLAAYKEVIYQVNQYLKGIFKKYNLTYKIKFAGSAEVEISYAFEKDDESLSIAFAKFYKEYSEKYRKEIAASENEGSLSIDNTPGKIVVRNEDYKKYLLDPEESSQPYKPAITGRRAVVVWEEGSEDENETVGSSTVYDEIDSLKEIIYHLQDLIRSGGGAGGGLFNTATSIDKYTTDRDLIPTVGAVIAYVDGMIKADNYEIIGTTISGDFGNVRTVNSLRNYYRLTLEEDNLVLG